MIRCMSQTFVWYNRTVDAKWRKKAWLGESDGAEGSQGNGTRAAVVLEEVRGGQAEDVKTVSKGSSVGERL